MPEIHLTTLLQGFGLGAGLIVAIGAQNAFVLRQGLKREHHFAVALVCTLNDILLITLGVAGLGTLIGQSAILKSVAFWGGAAFLLFYGFRSFRSATRPDRLETDTAGAQPLTLRAAVLAALAFSLLNPHVYLDTLVVIGSVGAQHPAGERASFAMGAGLASTVWFFGLAYGAARLAPLFRRRAVWRALDIAIGCIMWFIAASLIWEVIHPDLV
jgi:L-lysine exporter family protein LysE/ArgO